MLDPHWGTCAGGKRTHSCYACRACRKHDKNKRFATAKAANRGRAHKHCKCKVVQATFISYNAYVKLFGKPGALQRTSIDLRHKNARRIFEQGKAEAQGWRP
jgi:hypothetical protein